MKLVPALILLLAAMPEAPLAAEPSPRHAPLRPLKACLDPSRARAFHLLRSDRLLVDAGRAHFLLDLAWSCQSLASSHQLEFASANPGRRICGDMHDAVFAAGSAAQGLERCPVSRVTPLSADEYAAELRAQSHQGSVEAQR